MNAVPLRVTHLAKKYGIEAIFNDFSLAIEAGSLVTLLGASGSGKTTLLRMIAGLERADVGEIWIGEDAVQSVNRFVPPHKRQLGMVFQNYALWPHLTVGQNVALALIEQGLSRVVIAERVARALAQVELSHLMARGINQLSGGQQQRVALARALASEPRILLFDEPLSNLDAGLRDQLRHLIRAVQQQLAITAIFVTHDQKEALAISDRVALLERGRLLAYAPPEEIYTNPPTREVARFMGLVNEWIGQRVQTGVRFGRVVLKVPAEQLHGLPEEVCLLVRPEALRWCDAVLEESSTGMVLDVAIKSVQSYGAWREYELGCEAISAPVKLVEASAIGARQGHQKIIVPAAAWRWVPI